MKRLVLMVLAGIALSACSADFSRRYEAQRACRQEAGPQPYGAGMAFGVIGVAAMESSQEWQDWNHRVTDCFNKRMASNT